MLKVAQSDIVTRRTQRHLVRFFVYAVMPSPPVENAVAESLNSLNMVESFLNIMFIVRHHEEIA